MKKRLYNLKKFRVRRKDNELRFIFNSKVISLFYNKIFNLPFGPKCKLVDIPPIIKNCKDDRIIIGCIRGILDTDFGLMIKNKYGKKYPVLEGGFASEKLVLSLSGLFNRLKLKHNYRLGYKSFNKKRNKTYIVSKITISGHKRIKSFFDLIGFNNSKYSKKLNEVGPER